MLESQVAGIELVRLRGPLRHLQVAGAVGALLQEDLLFAHGSRLLLAFLIRLTHMSIEELRGVCESKLPGQEDELDR